MPPAALERSKTVTLRPSLFMCAAATTPEIPAPTTATRLSEVISRGGAVPGRMII
jgi:hypothetical protein